MRYLTTLVADNDVRINKRNKPSEFRSQRLRNDHKYEETQVMLKTRNHNFLLVFGQRLNNVERCI